MRESCAGRFEPGRMSVMYWPSPNRASLGFAARVDGRIVLDLRIIHELAHLNGAPGDESHEAELRVLECGLHSPNGPYNPDTRG